MRRHRGRGRGYRRHFASHRFDRLRNMGSKRGLYRSRSGTLFGVCKGLANYFDLSVGWVRFFTLLAFVFTGFWPVGALYLVAVFIMKPEPVMELRNEADEEFYRSYSESKRMAVNRLQRTYDKLDRRLRRMEDHVTSRDFNWKARVES